MSHLMLDDNHRHVHYCENMKVQVKLVVGGGMGGNIFAPVRTTSHFPTF